MGAPSVVLAFVLGQDGPQMPFAEDERLVGDLGPGGEHESFRVSVRPRAAGRDPHGLDAGIGQDSVKGRGELPGPITGQEPEVGDAITQIHQQVADLPDSPGPVRVGGDTKDVHVTASTSMTNRQYRRRRITAPSTWKKSVASIADAWVCRNFRHVVSERRSGAGGIFSALRTRRIVDAPTRWPSLSSSPWILLYPQPWFSVASRAISAAISALTGGRPVRCG
jgi:hypothetical protein